MTRQTVDLIVTSAGQLVTSGCGSSQTGKRPCAKLGIIADSSVAADAGVIVAVETRRRIYRNTLRPGKRWMRAGRAVIPGLVDPHTHVVFGGDRVHEFELRVQGASYMEIMAAGGGILSTVRATRSAPADELFATAYRRLDEMLALGTTTVEIKSGYGLDTATELKMLGVMARLDGERPCTIVPTFLGARCRPSSRRRRRLC
ncbi:MAG: hypothetical protein R2838_03410 [Caldilineaceae bacterium]